MKFDYVIGNPPYQEEADSDSATNGQKPRKNIFQHFQIQADKIASESSVLIYPGGRWIHQSGKGLKEFGKNLINDHRLSSVEFYPDKTFIDLYMKSGLYIAEIVKRLYQSEEMKRQLPDNKERLKHIFEKQVYGLAPTEIIYKIATSYILGFDEDTKDIKHNFKQLDALPYAKDGTLGDVLDELYPEQQ